MADPQLVGQMRQLVSLTFGTGTVNTFGEVTANTSSTTMYCRIQQHNREYELDNGTVMRTTSLLIFNVSTGFTPDFETRVWFPGESAATAALARRPQRIHAPVDEYGNLSHWEIGV